MGAIQKLPTSIFYSVLFHATLFALWMMLGAQVAEKMNREQPKYILMEVDPLPKSIPQTKNQVVQTQTVEKSKTVAPDAFLGEQNQIVEKQTISMPKTGTAARTMKANQPTQKEAVAEKAPVKPAIITATGKLAKFGIAISADQTESPKPKARSNPIEEAALTAQARGEYVKGFRDGEQTMLNTREYVFYGYFQRIRQRLDHAWEKSLRDRLTKYFYRGRQLASETDYMTQLLVSLNKEGHITRVQVIGASGTGELDEAAIKAFNDAGPFPNPPTGLVDTGGQVLVRWDFVLKT
jgi:protein TonB